MTTKFVCGTKGCDSRELILRGDPDERGVWLVTCAKGHEVIPVLGALYRIGPS